MFTLADLIESQKGIRPKVETPSFNGVVVDSRQAFPGALFIAIPGERVDGHDFVEDAVKRGAIVALIQHEIGGSIPVLDLRTLITEADLKIYALKPPLCLRVNNSLESLQKAARFWRRKLALRVIGITGSVGKSTTKEIVADVLSQRYRTHRNPGNLNNEIGLPISLLQLTENHERAVLEMGFYLPGEIAFLCDLALPHVGIVTNIGTVHAERAGSKEAIARGKAELVEALPPEPNGIAILNYDDPLVREMAGFTKAKVFYYGLDPRADLWADEVESLGLEGIRFRLHFRFETLYLRVPMIGRHSIQATLRAAAVGLVEGLTWQEIIQGLRSSTSQLRLITVRAANGALIIDDTYNASPESMLAALNLLHELDGRKVAVLGDMLELGPYERRGHALVGLRAAEVVDLLVTVGEKGKQISVSARLGGMHPDSIYHFDETDKVVQYLKENLTGNDIVLVKGSHGMRMDRIVNALEVLR